MEQRRSSRVCERQGGEKWQEIQVSNESSINTRVSGDGSFNMNRTVRDEEDEVKEVRRSSANAFDVESLAKLMANEYAMDSDPYNVQKGQELTELFRIKKNERELKAAELKICQLENRQRDEALYLSTTDEQLNAILRHRLFY
ncbi:hypothetical protein Tco_1426953 [Tanacetum coccineum]